MKIAIWGTGFCGRQFKRFCDISEDYDVVVAFDNIYKEKSRWMQVDVDAPNQIKKYLFDKIVVTPINDDTINSIRQQLNNLGIEEHQITVLHSDAELLDKVYQVSSYEPTDSRVLWLKNYAKYSYEQKMDGHVAECGVNRGDFSMYINEYFYDKKLYLFDTFDGFPEQDLRVEREMGDKAFLNGIFNDNQKFKDSKAERILVRMKHKEKCEIRKGYFPQTAKGLEDEKFCFVNLDMDLYAPQLEGLKFFYPRMVEGGVILVHDYFNSDLPGVKRAIDEFITICNKRIFTIPIGDLCSIAIIK